MTHWLIAAAAFPLACALADIERKKALAGKSSVTVTAICYLYLALSTGLALAFDGIPVLQPEIWLTLAIVVPLNAANRVTWFMALGSKTPISLVTPAAAAVPAFCLAGGFLVAGEMPDKYGAGAVGLICLGAYTLHLDPSKSAWAPFISIFKEPGSQLALFSSLITSFALVYERKGVKASSPVFFLFAQALVLSGGFNLYCLSFRRTEYLAEMKEFIPRYWRAGLAWSAANILMLISLKHILASYVAGFRALAILLVVLIAHYQFAEQKTLQRALGTGLMIAGMLIISLRSH